MSPLILLGLIASAGFALLSGGKKPTPGTTSGTTIKVPSQPTSIQTPAGKVTVKPPTATSTQSGTTITVPEVTITPEAPVAVPTPPELQVKYDNSPTLDYSEQQVIESSLPTEVYNAAMASNHLAFVLAAAARLAALGDTRAMDLTLRAANWGH
jgi:hypothetical protein